MGDTTINSNVTPPADDTSISNTTTKKDSQHRKYILTINNPLEKGLTHDKIKEIIFNNFPTCIYYCMADEIGNETGTYHSHIFLFFTSNVRFSTVQRNFPDCHIDPAKGLVSQCIAYITKTGKWADTDKADTTVPDTFEEFGNRPSDSKGRRTDLTDLYNMVENGLSNVEILGFNQDYILDISKIDMLRITLMTEKFKSKIRTDLKVIYRYGPTGTGKTRKVLEDYSPADVYRVTDYTHPFDSYSCTNSILCLDEFRSNLPIYEMLDILDIYPVELKARYSNKYACYNTVIIISNWKLEDQYKEVQRGDPNSWKAFLRRIHQIEVFQDDGSIEVYTSVDEYMSRFQSVKDETKSIPFKN